MATKPSRLWTPHLWVSRKLSILSCDFLWRVRVGAVSIFHIRLPKNDTRAESTSPSDGEAERNQYQRTPTCEHNPRARNENNYFNPTKREQTIIRRTSPGPSPPPPHLSIASLLVQQGRQGERRWRTNPRVRSKPKLQQACSFPLPPRTANAPRHRPPPHYLH